MAGRACVALLLAALLPLVAGHGVLSEPVSRAARLAMGLRGPAAYNISGSCDGQACQWYTQRAHLPPGQSTTNCDPGMRTMNVSCGSTDPIDWPCKHEAGVPWCAPGTAPVKSPCGIFAGGWDHAGRDMLDLDDTPMVTWTAGSVVNVSWYIIANHGGGYAYRLCKNSGQVTEECFQANHLEYASETQRVIALDGSVVTTLPAVRTSKGTHPAGSTWTRNPFPMERGYISPIPGQPELSGRGPFTVALQDQVKIPADLTPGNYVLSFRWDAEQVQQVWAQCSDVTIVAPSAAAPAPAAVERRASSARYAVCLGDSLGLDVNECDAWAKLYDSWGGKHWDIDPRIRTDPCASIKEHWQFSIVCNAVRDKQHISEIYLLGSAVTGTFLPDITAFSQLKALSIVDSNLTGPLPDNFGDLASLEMLWLDHNTKMTGPLPASLSKIGNQLSVLELHFSGFSGRTMLPALPFDNIPDCTLNGLSFACPLPAGADTCGAVCTP